MTTNLVNNLKPSFKHILTYKICLTKHYQGMVTHHFRSQGQNHTLKLKAWYYVRPLCIRETYITYSDVRGDCQSYPANSRNVPGFSRTFLKAPKIILNTLLKFPAFTIEILFELNQAGFLIRTQDQREIAKGKFPKEKDVDKSQLEEKRKD